MQVNPTLGGWIRTGRRCWWRGKCLQPCAGLASRPTPINCRRWLVARHGSGVIPRHQPSGVRGAGARSAPGSAAETRAGRARARWIRMRCSTSPAMAPWASCPHRPGLHRWVLLRSEPLQRRPCWCATWILSPSWRDDWLVPLHRMTGAACASRSGPNRCCGRAQNAGGDGKQRSACVSQGLATVVNAIMVDMPSTQGHVGSCLNTLQTDLSKGSTSASFFLHGSQWCESRPWPRITMTCCQKVPSPSWSTPASALFLALA